MRINNQDIKVSDFLKKIGVNNSVVYRGFSKLNNWDFDQWNFKISKGGKTESFDYKSGLGHRIKSKNFRKLKNSDLVEIKKLKELYHFKIGDKAIYQIGDSLSYAVIPTQASVLYCLLLDSQAGNESFNNWCDSFGYDNDSMKIFKLYQDCCENSKKLKSIFSLDQILELETLLEDY